MNNSAATPVIEYRVWTKCGRIFSFSATDNQDLIDRFKPVTGMEFGMSMPWAMWDDMQEDGYEQAELNHEIEMEIAS